MSERRNSFLLRLSFTIKESERIGEADTTKNRNRIVLG